MHMKNIVYHSSREKGLKKLEPYVKTYKEPRVYATKNLATSALFVGKNYDLICQIGVGEDSKPYVYERFPKALEYAFENQSGSIYVLDGSSFEGGKTFWVGEVVSEVPVEVLKEINIDNSLEYLFKLEKEGKLSIYRYPNTPDGKIKDKEDIIERVFDWVSGPDSPVLEDVRRFHPDILEEVRERLMMKGVEI